jgi:hypothetical protein
MRGHAQMIPFGLGAPILSLIAHDKLGWFLDDIGHPEWGVDVTRADFPDALAACWRAIAVDLPGCRGKIAEAREKLWQITERNLALLDQGFGPAS